MLGENNQKIHEEIERSRNQATLLQERIRQSCQSQQRLEERQNQTKEELKISLADGEELKRKAQIANNTADKLELALQEENSSVQKVENDIKAKEEEIKLKQEQDNEKRKQIEEQNKVLLLLKRDMSDIDVNIENQHSAHKNAINDIISSSFISLFF